MAKISLKLSAVLTKDCQKVAKKLGISRAQFMRQAIEHEVKDFELKAMVRSVEAMKKSQSYLDESKEIMGGFD